MQGSVREVRGDKSSLVFQELSGAAGGDLGIRVGEPPGIRDSRVRKGGPGESKSRQGGR